MKQAQYLIIMGDIHGDFSFLNQYINRHIRQNRRLRDLAAGYESFEVLLLQCGDFGYWPHSDPVHTWFPAGEITPADMKHLPDPATQPVDWVISHTSPWAFDSADKRVSPCKNQDSSRRHLETVGELFRPSR